jgi:putative membrane protein
MSQTHLEEQTHRFEVGATAANHFSWIRTRLSLERTLMSWVRTAIALIGFGFTIVKFFETIGTMQGVAPAVVPGIPRYFGLALIGAGIIALAISIWQYRWGINYLTGPQYAPIAGAREKRMHTPIFAVSVGIMLIGIFAFGAILLRAV